MRLPDLDNSQAILIGSARYTQPDLTDLPAAAANVTALRQLLTQPDSGGFRPDNCHSFLNPEQPNSLAWSVSEIAKNTTDTVLVYYAGHGLLDERGELCFGMRDSDQVSVAFSCLKLDLLRQALQHSPAKNRVLILDCCFSGRAIEAMSDPASLAGGQININGVYTLTSTSATRPAYAPADAKHTAFTGELIDLLRQGLPDGPELLTLTDMYFWLLERMRSQELPPPQQRGTNTVGYLALTRNRAQLHHHSLASQNPSEDHGTDIGSATPRSDNNVSASERGGEPGRAHLNEVVGERTDVAGHGGASTVRGSADELWERAQRGELARTLATALQVDHNSADEYGELGAWKKSLKELLELLHRAGLGHLEVMLEYHLPYSPKRVDAILCGQQPDKHTPCYILVELKRWSAVFRADEGLVRVKGMREQQLHPSEQVRNYCQHLLDFTPWLARQPDTVRGIAYLHNYIRNTSWNLDDEYDDYGQVYARDDTSDLIEDLHFLLDTDPSSRDAAYSAADKLLSAPKAPAKTLLRTAANAFEESDNFVLLDEQQAAFRKIWNAVTALTTGGSPQSVKEVFIVLGGPGSGKSAIATNLLSKLARRSTKVLHATGSKAFTETMRDRVAGDSTRHNRLFTYFNQFGTNDQNELDVIICDEAHRVRGAGRGNSLGQIKQLIAAAKVPVFLLDEHQVVRPGEYGTLRNIERAARAAGCKTSVTRLDGQFRCGGSPNYDQWVLRLLGITPGGPVRWSDFVTDPDDEYIVDSAESPHALEKWLTNRSQMSGGTARIAAGFCWHWSDPVSRNGTARLVEDIEINGWRRPWNAKAGKEVTDAPSSSLWASDPRGFNQVGCIYTAQGFEYDWAGVIFGPDLVIRDGHWCPQPENSHDKSVRGCESETFLRLIRNTYKVLLTRGMQGVCVYSTDPETNAYLQRYAR